MSSPKENKPTSPRTSSLPSRDQIEKEALSALESVATNQKASDLRARAEETNDPTEKQALEQEAGALDKKAKKQLRLAQRLQSGAWQGAGAGAGIGLGTGIGLGSVVGTVTGGLVGGIAAVPTTLVGGLVGTVTGIVHGPWVTVGGKKGKEKKDGGEVEEKEGKQEQESEERELEAKSTPEDQSD